MDSLWNSISKKVMIGYAAILVLLLATAFLVSQKNVQIEQTNKDFSQSTLPTLRAFEQTQSALNALHINAYALYGTTLSLNEYQKRIAEHQKQLNQSLESLKQLEALTESSLREQLKEINQSLKSLEATMSSAHIDWDVARSHLSQLQQEMDVFQTTMTRSKTSIVLAAQDGAKHISQQLASMNLLTLGSVLLISIITCLAFFLSQRQIAVPIKTLSKTLDNIADQKDLTHDVYCVSNDEIRTAANSINELLLEFRKGNIEIRASSDYLNESAEKLNDTATVSDEQVLKFSNFLDDLLEKISKLENSIEETAVRTMNASDMGRKGAEQVKNGAENVNKTTISIARLAKDVDKSAEMLLNLQNAGDQVSSVVSTIAQIAEQTNLLALNAAIEAARAGESGRGFAVVADEVRTLASRTHESTHEINNILDTIVGSISSTVTSMESNKSKANDAVALAESTVASLNIIQETVISLSQENHELARLEQVTKTDAQKMKNSVDDIQSASQQLTQSSYDTRSAAGSLIELSNDLKKIVNRFKV